MKTASLGLLEVPVVCVNAGGGCRTPPLLVTSRAVTGHSPFLCFLQESFLANERENIFGGSTVKKEKKPQMAGLVPLVCT